MMKKGIDSRKVFIGALAGGMFLLCFIQDIRVEDVAKEVVKAQVQEKVDEVKEDVEEKLDSVKEKAEKDVKKKLKGLKGLFKGKNGK
jgi:DNA-binding transcriptional MerR regulator